MATERLPMLLARRPAARYDHRNDWRHPAEALQVDDKLGSLSPGLFGDIAIYDGREAENPYRAVIGADAARTVLVLRRSALPFPFVGGPHYVGSVALYGDASALAHLPDTWHEAYAGMPLCEPIAVCGLDKMACPLRETWWTATMPQLGTPLSLTALAQANTASYPLFFCDAPPDEPSCVPARSGEYDGAAVLTGRHRDRDGDGIRDAADNCKKIFNSIRPMDEGSQPDADGDGLGDVCDKHPLTSD